MAMASSSMQPTNEMRSRWIALYGTLVNHFGGKDADKVAGDAAKWHDQQESPLNSEFALYAYAIKLAEDKLNAPVIVLDASEYEEVMKAEAIMEELV